jgi:hypothetical protein
MRRGEKTLAPYLIKIAPLGGYLVHANDPPPRETVTWQARSRT